MKRPDGLPFLTECSICRALTWRPMPDDPQHRCSECYDFDAPPDSDDFDDRGDYEHQINEESDL